MQGSAELRVREHDDHALDLAPAAEIDDIAPVATGVRTRCGFKAGVIAEPSHQLMRISYRPAIGDKWKTVQRRHSPVPAFHDPSCVPENGFGAGARLTVMKPMFTKCRSGTSVPSGDALALQIGTWHGPAMAESPRNPTGGGIFIALGAAAGVIGGQIFAQTSIGLIVGVGVGSAIALLLWWRERG